MPTERCHAITDKIRAADMMGGMFDTIYGKASALIGTGLAAAPFWIDHLSDIAKVCAFVGGAIIWGLNAYVGVLKIQRERAEIRRIENDDVD